MSELPNFLQRYYSRNNLVMIYPEQFGEAPVLTSFTDPLSSDISSQVSPLLLRIKTYWRKALRMIKL